MKQIKVSFQDGGIFCQKLVLKLLQNDYDIIEDNDDPDILIYSWFGDNHKKYSCKKIFVNGENRFPDFNECDYVIGSHNMAVGSRYCRVPFFVFNKEYDMLCNDKKVEIESPFNRKFCSAVISNNRWASPVREEFMKRLHEKMPIDSIGKVFHTVDYDIKSRPAWAENQDTQFTNPQKIEFLSQYKFNIAMENSSVDGYCTEKITDAFAANTVPIYFGDPNIANDFDKRSFICITDFYMIENAINYILDINNNEKLYLDMLNAKNIKNKDYYEKLKNFLMQAIEGPVFEHSFIYKNKNIK